MIKFTKAHAYGNDFLYVRADRIPPEALSTLAVEMCQRHTGIGADGLIVYDDSTNGVTMQLFNADGGGAEISGNGVRGLAALLLQQDDRAQPEIVIQTDAGPKKLTRVAREQTRDLFRAEMGTPKDIQQAAIAVGNEWVEAVTLDIGNPHCVLLGPLPDTPTFQRLGSALERHKLFAKGTNVEFAYVEAPERVRALIWERGVGPTTSSGTGSCAVLIAARAFGGAAGEAEVITPGGSQHVEWKADGVYLTGWAEVLCEGDWLRQIPRTS
jgi:diaminopimelate epimerase